MHTTMVPDQVRTQKIQAGVQVSRLEGKDVIFSIGSTLEVFILVVFVLDRNICKKVDEGVENLKLSQGALEMPSGMECDLPTWVEDFDDTISDTEGEESDLQTFFEYDDASVSVDWILYPYHNVDDEEARIQDLFYESDQAYEDVVEQVTDSLVYEDVGDEDVDKFFIERSDFGYVISKSTRKRKRSDKDDVSCSYALIGSQSKKIRLNVKEVGGKDILDDVP
ncbi:hypothetical protein Tco_0296834 [Tanacetum coccineum]